MEKDSKAELITSTLEIQGSQVVGISSWKPRKRNCCLLEFSQEETMQRGYTLGMQLRFKNSEIISIEGSLIFSNDTKK